MILEQLNIRDILQIKSLIGKVNSNKASLEPIDAFINKLSDSQPERPLTDDEVVYLAKDELVKIWMIHLFLLKNVLLEYLRKENVMVTGDSILVNEYWDEINSTLKKKLFLSRDVAEYFAENGGEDSDELASMLNTVKNIEISDLRASALESNGSNPTRIALKVTGKYEIQEGDTGAHEYTFYERKTPCFVGLYDPFQFEVPQSTTAFRHMNNNSAEQTINSIITLKFAYPEITVLKNDGCYLKIYRDDIPSFMNECLKNGAVDEALYNNVKESYPRLFYPQLDKASIQSLMQQIQGLLTQGHEVASQENKPLLIVLSEVHGSKESLLLHVIISLLASKMGVRHMIAETINVHHQLHGGFEARAEEMMSLLSFSENDLGMQVKDLEASLHYKNTLTPYPYHGIPHDEFGIPAREASWLIDVKSIMKDAILVVGTGHFNSMINGELKELFHIVPIDCTCDREFSDLLSVDPEYFIPLERSVCGLSYEQLIALVKSAGENH